MAADRLPDHAYFEELRAWVAEHLNAIDLEDVDGDVAQVLSSLDCIVHGRIGCTERSDYTEAQWSVLLACKERESAPPVSAAVSPAEPPEAKRELTEYEKGYLDGVLAYSYRSGRDGEVFVGKDRLRTYESAALMFLKSRGIEGWKVNVR